jgi:hypothetical protein
MKNYWHSMVNHGVSLYIGAHTHTYQRLLPYHLNDTFSGERDNYKTDGGYLMSVVERVAGNDNKIVEEIEVIEDFTVSYTVDETGFGILETSKDKTVYRTNFSFHNSKTPKN